MAPRLNAVAGRCAIILVLAALGACACADRSPVRQEAAEQVDASTTETPEQTASSSPAPEVPIQCDVAPMPAVVAPPPSIPRRAWPRGYLGFDDACEPGTRVVIAAVGDLLPHPELQRQAFAARDRYRNLWRGVDDLLAKADIAYANLEGPCALGITRRRELVPDPGLRFDNRVYTGFSLFNYHPALIEDLVHTGVDVISTANNHALDRGPLGIDRTIEALDAAGLRYTGTRCQGEEERSWHTITEARGIRIAWIACTEHTNNETDDFDQVLHCYEEDERVLNLVHTLSTDPAIDAVIVTPHWGMQYNPTPRRMEVAFARKLLQVGATAVIGSHPHVLQPWERVVQPDGREGFVLYSLGNFASHQQELPQRTSIVLYLGLLRGADGRVRLYGVRYVPIHVRMEGDFERFFVEAIDRVGGPDDARQHVIDTFGRANIIAPNAELRLALQCEPRRRRR